MIQRTVTGTLTGTTPFRMPIAFTIAFTGVTRSFGACSPTAG